MTIHQQLIENGIFIATAESLTAGLLGSELVKAAGASNFYLGGIVAYQDEIKQSLLGVDAELLAHNTAVDAEVAIQMAESVRASFARDCSRKIEQVIGISTTGVAGPDAVGEHPVGQVFIGLASVRGARALELKLSGTRDQIRTESIAAALSALEDEIHLLLG